MLFKFFGSRHHNVPLNPNTNPNPTPSYGRLVAVENPLIMKIIHAGGVVESYYKAFPAAWIVDKYPNFILARPEIFQLPWDSIVRPEEVLVPGKKYFLVPISTVKKLLRRMRKPSINMSNGLICQDKDTSSCSRSLSICKATPVSRRVRFIGIESKTRNNSNVVDDKRKKKKKSSNGKGLRKKNERFTPSLKMIDEIEGAEDY